MRISLIMMVLVVLVLSSLILSQTTASESLENSQTSDINNDFVTEWVKIDTMQEKAASIEDVRPITVDGYPVFPHHFSQRTRATPDQKIIIGFQIKPKMSPEEISGAQNDPSSPLYQKKHITGADLQAVTVNPEATNAVKSYLERHGADVLITSDNGLMLSATAPIHAWEKALNTQFHHYQDEKNPKAVLIRAPHISLPTAIANHVEDIRNAVDFPSPFGRITKSMREARLKAMARGPQPNDVITPIK